MEGFEADEAEAEVGEKDLGCLIEKHDVSALEQQPNIERKLVIICFDPGRIKGHAVISLNQPTRAGPHVHCRPQTSAAARRQVSLIQRSMD